MRGRRSAFGAIAMGTVLAAAAVAQDLNPPLVGMTEHKDKAGVVSIELPVTWEEEQKSRGPTHLATWTGWYQRKTEQTPHPDQLIFVYFERAYRHADLLRYFDTNTPGTFVEGSVTRGDGWVQHCQKEESESCFYTVRYVEAPGGVLNVVVKNSIQFQQYIEGHTKAVLETLEVVGEVPEVPLPEGYRAVHSDGVEIWTNGKPSNDIKKAVQAYKEGWAIASQLCAGDRVADVPPRMIFCADRDTYRDLCEHATGKDQTPPYGFPDRDRWSVVMLLEDAKNGDFAFWARRWGALQYVRRHFGGMLPAWIEIGIAQRPALESKRGKLVKPHRDDMRYARESAEKQKLTLDQLMDMPMNDITSSKEQLLYQVWAWHYWFQEVVRDELPGIAYRDFLEIIRGSGDVERAKKAFDAFGRETTTTMFHAWLASWK